jgi:hydroxypyruvate isomerase
MTSSTRACSKDRNARAISWPPANLTAIVEPLNSLVNHKGFFLTTCVEGAKLIRQVDNPHVRLLFDIYHEQVQEGNMIRTLTEVADLVSVFHVADNPSRNDPGTGEINYRNGLQSDPKNRL